MKMLNTFASHSGCVTLMGTMVILAKINLVYTLAEGTARGSYFRIKTANNVNHTNVNRMYENTGSVLHCGMRCANIMAPSFYFVDQTSTCHCNNHHDSNVEEDTEPGSIKYGSLAVQKNGTSDPGLRQGNSSECQALFDSVAQYNGIYNNDIGEQIFCNMTELGWVVFQRRLDGNVEFYRNWTEYVNGFGDPDGEFWLGLEAIHQMTKNGCELHIYLEAEPNVTVQDNGYARYSTFSVANATDNYRLNVSGFSGNVGNSLSYQDGFMFSTYDVDNDDRSDRNCAQTSVGAWWYSSCHMTNLNGRYLAGNHSTYAEGVVWKNPWDFYYSLIRTVMAFRC